MKPKSLSALAAIFTSLYLVLTPAGASAGADPQQVAISVARWLEKGHYTRAKLDDAMSRKLLDTYLTALDYNRLYFTQADVDEFQRLYAERLDDAILSGDLDPARQIFQRYRQRVEDRMAKNKELLKKNYKFNTDTKVKLNRQKAPWSSNAAEADKLWKELVEAELLRETLNEFPIREPRETLERRYAQILRNVQEMEDEDIVKTFLSSLAQTYDPHSEYLSPSDMENFQISMRLSLVGVGAVLRSDDGYAKVMEVVPGGPADLDGRLRVNDRIVAVAQGDKEFEDVVDMKLDKVVEKIRGKKGSMVRLLVLPADATDPSVRKVIDIQRDEVKLKDQEAKAELLKLEGSDGRPTKVGWITLPSFYANMDGRGSGNSKSTTADVAALINRLNKEGMEGLVIDLRRDGGGSLEEAINLTGLFIPRGPVVQAKDSNGKITVSQDTDPRVAYDGPLVVLMNRLSASASEIFAAALQDYGRAVIVGDERSFGKGTVQTVLELGRLMMPFSLSSTDAGALKLTIQKFYRVKGGSTQLRGVESDIVLPSLTDNPEIGEASLNNELPYDEVAPVRIVEGMASRPLFIDELRERSLTRVAADPEFAYVVEDATRLREKLEKNEVSLNIATRKAELAAEKARKEKRKVERSKRGEALKVAAYEITLDDVNSDELRKVAYNRKSQKDRFEDAVEAEETGNKEKEEEVLPDPIRDEAVRIIVDLIELSNQPKTAKARSE
ncbi:MAG: carboxy terminal-processing peptidase [Terrimicrobiaceae bacterium]